MRNTLEKKKKREQREELFSIESHSSSSTNFVGLRQFECRRCSGCWCWKKFTASPARLVSDRCPGRGNTYSIILSSIYFMIIIIFLFVFLLRYGVLRKRNHHCVVMLLLIDLKYRWLVYAICVCSNDFFLGLCFMLNQSFAVLDICYVDSLFYCSGLFRFTKTVGMSVLLCALSMSSRACVEHFSTLALLFFFLYIFLIVNRHFNRNCFSFPPIFLDALCHLPLNKCSKLISRASS